MNKLMDYLRKFENKLCVILLKVLKVIKKRFEIQVYVGFEWYDKLKKYFNK